MDANIYCCARVFSGVLMRNSLFCLFLFTCVLAAAPAGFRFPANTVNQPLTIEGRLEMAGQNYFLDPRFVIVDNQNNRVPVTSWAPLELPPSRPGAARQASRKGTMRDFLHQRFAVTGIHRVATGRPGQAGQLAEPGDSYLEVQKIVDSSGVIIYEKRREPGKP